MASLQLWQQSEVIRKGAFPFWGTKKFNVLSDFIKRGEVTNIGERDFRIPFKKTFGGRVGKYDPQMGDMGRGTQMTGDVMIQSYFNLRLNFEMDMLAIKATQDRKIAIQDPFKDAVANGFFEFKLYRDKFYHSDGTAILATATAHSAVSGTSVYTLNSAFGAQRLRRGQYVTVYNPGNTAALSSSVLYITALNTQGKTITLSGVVPGAAATDNIEFEGVSGSAPAGIRGLYYWINSATSGTTAGVDRALEPTIISKSVDASGGPLLAELVMALYHRILNDRGEVGNGLLGIVAPAQQAYVYSNVMSIQNYDISKSSVQAVDRLPALKGKKSFMWGDVPHYVDIHQSQTRADYIIPDMWGIARLDEEKFFQTPGTSQRFFPLYGGSGAPAAGVWFSLTCDENLYTIDPGAQGTIATLSTPALYT
jgi:hypothetical protein